MSPGLSSGFGEYTYAYLVVAKKIRNGLYRNTALVLAQASLLAVLRGHLLESRLKDLFLFFDG